MKGAEHLTVLYGLDQLAAGLAYQKANPGTSIFCLDFWVERELAKKNIPFISLKEFVPEEETEGEWWKVAQDIAREWYRLPAMAFFEYDGIRIGEALEPMMEMYLSKLLYYTRIFLVLKKAHPNARVHIPLPPTGESSSVGPLAFFEQRAVADAARMAGISNVSAGERITPRRHVFSRTAWKSCLVYAYNAVVSFAPRRRLKIYASEYWSHIGPVIAKMDDVELVLMESGELRNISWRDILRHRIRVRHPADAAGEKAKRAATERSGEFLKQWTVAKGSVADFLLVQRGALDWGSVLEACEYLVTYSARVIADIEGLRRILKEERPGVVLQRASIGGRQHHFFLMARVAAQLKIPSIELQHAGAIFDPNSVHSRLETSYLAAYGDVEREQYAHNGYAPERIVAVGSPRLDRYRDNAGSYSEMRGRILESFGLNPGEKAVMVAVPTEQLGLSYLSFSSYDIAKLFQKIQSIRQTLPKTQFIFKFRQRNCTTENRAYLQELFPDGGIAATDADPHSLIYASDCVLSGNSTIMYEAMMSERPLILYPWKRHDYHFALYGAVAPCPQSEGELTHILRGILSDESYAHDLLAKQQHFMQRHAFDGHSAERVAALVTSFKTP